ncbi:MAG: hypothetical protein HYZ73_07570 [Elusimicrobia bacterium]|nr:hypothetical protein [Elusimicrobiota bacterium]
MEQENHMAFPVYVSLVTLTLLTIGSFFVGWGRIQSVVLALSIAATKAALIAFYYMRLRAERPLIAGIVVVGMVTVLLLALGILPDVALR